MAWLRKNGRVWRHPLAVLLVTENGLEDTEYGFIASRRVGNAVVRNRAKRRMRECVRHRLGDIESGWDCLFIARPRICQASSAELAAAVAQLLERASLLKGV